MTHPGDVLLEAQSAAVFLPVCDHYSGLEKGMRKSLQLQAEMTEEFGACVFDVTLDCEDGAAVGQEAAQAELVASLLIEAAPNARVAARIHAVRHAAFATDIATIVGTAGHRLAHLMIPKVESAADVQLVDQALKQLGGAAATLPIHVLVESAAAVHNAFEIAAHPRVQSISFGLMDFVSSHNGAIPAAAMRNPGQFTHPLVARAKLEIASACHAFGKVPSHCVVTELNDVPALQAAAARAATEFGYTRMWSIHPEQIRPILVAFAPSEEEVEYATDLIAAGARADWAPVSFDNKLQDRASYRYYWQVLQRAHQTGRLLPAQAQGYFTATRH